MSPTEPVRIRGVLAPVLTPFKADLSPDTERFVAHCRWLTRNNVGLTPFGTNSEGNSLSMDERMALLDKLVEAGIDPARLMPGTGCCSLAETATLTRHAVKLGAAGVLMLPPFFYKAVSDEGLYRHYSEVVQRVGDDRMAIYLYHIPPVAQVPISLGLMQRLFKAYPKAIAGTKDSSGDWNNTKAILDAFAGENFDVFPGTDAFLLPGLRHGAAGCISAAANVNPASIHAVYSHWKTDRADALQQGLDTVREIFESYPMIAAMKQAVAHFAGDPAWATMRPPLEELDEPRGRELIERLKAVGFDMPGLPGRI